jgi:uncharacterized protein
MEGLAGFFGGIRAQYKPFWLPEAAPVVQESVRDEHGCTDLMYAVTGASVQDITALLATTQDLDARCATGKTALHYAILAGHKESARRLLGRGAHPDMGDIHGVTPLMLASMLGHEDVVAMLLQRGADPHRPDHAGRDAKAYALGAGQRRAFLLLAGMA